MKSTHNTIRALAIGIGLTLLVITGTAAMMAVFSGPAPATDIYRRAAVTPIFEPATRVATGHDSVLYERVVLADGRVQWVLTEAPPMTLPIPVTGSGPAAVYAGADRPANYTLVVKPAGLSKAIRNCGRSAYRTYDIACNTMS